MMRVPDRRGRGGCGCGCTPVIAHLRDLKQRYHRMHSPRVKRRGVSVRGKLSIQIRPQEKNSPREIEAELAGDSLRASTNNTHHT